MKKSVKSKKSVGAKRRPARVQKKVRLLRNATGTLSKVQDPVTLKYQNIIDNGNGGDDLICSDEGFVTFFNRIPHLAVVLMWRHSGATLVDANGEAGVDLGNNLRAFTIDPYDGLKDKPGERRFKAKKLNANRKRGLKIFFIGDPDGAIGGPPALMFAALAAQDPEIIIEP